MAIYNTEYIADQDSDSVTTDAIVRAQAIFSDIQPFFTEMKFNTTSRRVEKVYIFKKSFIESIAKKLDNIEDCMADLSNGEVDLFDEYTSFIANGKPFTSDVDKYSKLISLEAEIANFVATGEVSEECEVE